VTALAVSPDVEDQVWLDEQVADLGRGIEAAKAIWANWFDGRQVGRLHPGLAPGDYIANLGLRLTLPEALAAMPDASTRQVAAVAGVSKSTVATARVQHWTPEPIRGADGKTYQRVVRRVEAEIIEHDEEPRIDDALWDSLMAVIDAIEGLTGRDAADIAATVPQRRRAATAKRLRRLGTYLGRIAWTLEGSEATS
jgi:hypothetical protein